MLLYLISFLSASRLLVYLNPISSSSLCLWSQCFYLCGVLFLPFSSSFRFSCLALTKVFALFCFLCRAIVRDCQGLHFCPPFVDFQSSQHSLLKKLSFFQCTLLFHLLKSTCLYLHTFIYSTWLLNLIVIMSTVRRNT